MRPIITAAAAIATVVVALGPGGERPEIGIGARRLVEERARRADTALGRLAAELAPAVDAGRTAAARVVVGDAPPGDGVVEAASMVAAAEPAAGEARRAVAALDAARRAGDPDAEPIGPATEAGELGSIASQLEASADAADDFAAMRRRAEGVAPALQQALAALEAGDAEAARASIADAREAHDAVASWDVELETLPVWIETTDAMIGAVETMVRAVEAGDRPEVEAAAAEIAALADDAATADRALRIAIGEGGSAVTAAPLGRLARVLAAIDERRARIGSLGTAGDDG